jgi:uncharacterized protein YcfJ
MFERPSRHAAALALLLAAGAAAGDVESDSYLTYAEVVSVTPHYGWREVETPVSHCEDVPTGWRSHDGRAGFGGGADGYRHRYRDGGDRHRHGNDAAAGLVGGLIGGLVGHQFGGGNGKKALTIVGAALGASIAQDHVRRSRHDGDGRYGHGYDDRYAYGYNDRYGYDDRRGHGYRDRVADGHRVVRRCRETVTTRQVRGIQGYDVTYRYQGRIFNKWMNDHPGDRVRVHVDVAPDDGVAMR